MTFDSTLPSDGAAGPSTGPGWHELTKRLPRRDQQVRILTQNRVSHQAAFEVAFTEEWPSGVAWLLQSGERLPFADVVAWSSDPDAQPPPRVAPEPPVPAPKAPPPRPTALAGEIRDEVERTKDVLRLLPQTLMEWSPHPSIPTLSTLALRTVRIAARIGWILDLDEVEISFEPDVPAFETVDQIFVSYNANADEVATLLEGLDAERLRETWRLVRNGGLVSEMPRGQALRWYGLTPLIHHRAEISLMLRALGINPPHLYPGWAFADAVAGERWEVPSTDSASGTGGPPQAG